MQFKSRLANREKLAGLFVKTPSSEIIEILTLSGIDFISLDAEHAAIGRRELDWSLALARSLGLPALVRLACASPELALQALDGGAAGLVIPHVLSADHAREITTYCSFGKAGRGYAGSTRSAGFTTRPMGDVLASAAKEYALIAQIEDPDALEEVEAIAAVEGIDALFFGAADLAVGLGLAKSSGPQIDEAFLRVKQAASAAGKPLAAFCADAAAIPALFEKGAHVAFAGSDQSAVLSAGRAIAAAAGR